LYPSKWKCGAPDLVYSLCPSSSTTTEHYRCRASFVALLLYAWLIVKLCIHFLYAHSAQTLFAFYRRNGTSETKLPHYANFFFLLAHLFDISVVLVSVPSVTGKSLEACISFSEVFFFTPMSVDVKISSNIDRLALPKGDFCLFMSVLYKCVT